MEGFFNRPLDDRRQRGSQAVEQFLMGHGGRIVGIFPHEPAIWLPKRTRHARQPARERKRRAWIWRKLCVARRE